jgi:hypothetical protein
MSAPSFSTATTGPGCGGRACDRRTARRAAAGPGGASASRCVRASVNTTGISRTRPTAKKTGMPTTKAASSTAQSRRRTPSEATSRCGDRPGRPPIRPAAGRAWCRVPPRRRSGRGWSRRLPGTRGPLPPGPCRCRGRHRGRRVRGRERHAPGRTATRRIRADHPGQRDEQEAGLGVHRVRSVRSTVAGRARRCPSVGRAVPVSTTQTSAWSATVGQTCQGMP